MDVLVQEERVRAVQRWPALVKMAKSEPLTASSRSASGKTMFGLLPPSSRETFLIVPAAAPGCAGRSPSRR